MDDIFVKLGSSSPKFQPSTSPNSQDYNVDVYDGMVR